jgi:hypothetical protein
MDFRGWSGGNKSSFTVSASDVTPWYIGSRHLFIDTEGSPDRMLEFNPTAGTRKAGMGGTLQATSGSEVTFSVHIVGVPDGRVEIVEDGKPFDTTSPGASTDEKTRVFSLREWPAALVSN